MLNIHRESLVTIAHTTVTSSGVGTAYPSEAPAFSTDLVGFVLSNLKYSVKYFGDYCVPFLLSIVLSVLQFTASDDPFGIF